MEHFSPSPDIIEPNTSSEELYNPPLSLTQKERLLGFSETDIATAQGWLFLHQGLQNVIDRFNNGELQTNEEYYGAIDKVIEDFIAQPPENAVHLPRNKDIDE